MEEHHLLISFSESYPILAKAKAFLAPL